MNYSLEEEKVIKEIKDRNAKTVLVQLPNGLKRYASRICRKFEKNGIKTIVSGEPCWGGCDLALDEAKTLDVELIVHYGHAEFFKQDFPVLYVETRYNANIKNLVKDSLELLKGYGTIGLMASIQHLHQLNIVKKILENKNKKVIIPKKTRFSRYDGHMLGCSIPLNKVEADAFLVIANRFHGLGAALSTVKPVILMDPYTKDVEDLDNLKQKIIKQRIIKIEKAKQANKIGIIISLKPGQKFGSPYSIKEKLEGIGKEVMLLAMKEITPEKLINLYDIDVFIEMACPRISIEDSQRYNKPILNYKEALVLVGEKKTEDLIEEGFI